MTTKSKLPSTSVTLRAISIKESGSTNIGSVVNTEKVETTNTVLSQEFQLNGGIIDLGDTYVYDNWKRLVNKLTVPPVEATFEMGKTVAILHPIARRANNVLRVLRAFKEGEQNLHALQKSVQNYCLELCDNLFGKGGIYNRYVLGPRMKNSFRAVIVPGRYKNDPFGDSFEWVGIPSVICDKLEIALGDKVIIGRDPTIWYGSIEVLRAYPVMHDAIEIHPLILPQLGADHDGDQIWGMKPSNDIPEEAVAKFTKKYATWGRNFLDLKQDPEPQWTEGFQCNFLNDEKERVKTTGLSISPADIVDHEESLQRILSYCGKGARARGKAEYDELEKAYSQLPLGDWLDLSNMINRANLAMKVFMGPVGLVALRLAVLGHNVPHIEEACNLLAERCAQSLLDAKHLTAEQIQNYRPAEIFEILNLQREELDTPEKMYEAIKSIVNCDERVMPALAFLIEDERGLAKLSREEFPLFEGTTWTGESAEGGYSPEVLFNDNACAEEGIFSQAFLHAMELGNEKRRSRKTSSEEHKAEKEDSTGALC